MDNLRYPTLLTCGGGCQKGRFSIDQLGQKAKCYFPQQAKSHEAGCDFRYKILLFQLVMWCL